MLTDAPKSSCWDGKNLDSPNHVDHVAHPTGGPASFAVTNGKCPATHPVKIPQVHLEVCTPNLRNFQPTNKPSQIVWDTTKYTKKEDWPADGSQPLVLSNGDP